MENCPNCGEKVDENSVFCQNCGFKISGESENIVPPSRPKVQNTNSFGMDKAMAMTVYGYLTLFIQIVAILASWYHLKKINADRIILYPLLSVMLSYFAAFNLVKDEKTLIHGIIVGILSVLLFVFGIIAI